MKTDNKVSLSGKMSSKRTVNSSIPTEKIFIRNLQKHKTLCASIVWGFFPPYSP